MIGTRIKTGLRGADWSWRTNLTCKATTILSLSHPQLLTLPVWPSTRNSIEPHSKLCVYRNGFPCCRPEPKRPRGSSISAPTLPSVARASRIAPAWIGRRTAQIASHAFFPRSNGASLSARARRFGLLLLEDTSVASEHRKQRARTATHSNRCGPNSEMSPCRHQRVLCLHFPDSGIVRHPASAQPPNPRNRLYQEGGLSGSEVVAVLRQPNILELLLWHKTPAPAGGGSSTVDMANCTQFSNCTILDGATTNGTFEIAQYNPAAPVPHWHQRME
jgi:hypothetical protein